MKKKIFLITAMVALLVCLFAISVSAANEVTLVGGEKVDFETVFKIEKSGGVDNVVTGYNSGYGSSSMTDVIFPDYIVGIEANGLFGKYGNPASTTIKTLTFAAKDEFFISGDNIFSGIPLEKVTFNPDCVVEMRKGGFSGCTSLTEITFPKFKKLSTGAFANCSNMVSTNPLVLAEGMTEFGADAFQNCTKLNCVVYFPSTLTTIKEETFNNTAIVGVDFSKCARLTTLEKAIFVNCDSLTTIDMSACVSLTSLSNSFAENCDNLTNVKLPPNLEKINEKSFAWCCNLQSLVIPASCKLIGIESFQFARKDQELQVFTLYIQSNVNFDPSGQVAFYGSSAKVEFILIGENVTSESFKAANTYSLVTGATVVDYKGGENPWTYVPGQAITSHTIVENYCRSLALTGEHNSKDNPCVINCSSCGLTSIKENPQHTLLITVDYKEGYDKAGIKIASCSNEGCTHSIVTEVPALFTCLGYSAPENGNGGISIGFKVNDNAILEYEKETGKEISYGLFVGVKEKLGTNDIIGADGKASNGAIIADIPRDKFVIISIKMVGFENDTQKTADFAFGAYAIATKDNEKEISYMQEGIKKENEKYVFTTFNEAVAKANNK